MPQFLLLTPDELAARDRLFGAPRRASRHLTEEERDFLIRTHGYMTAVEQAAQLQCDYDAVCYQRQRLIRAGRIARETRAYRRPYTPDEDAEIGELARQGLSIRRIARKLDRTFSSMVTHITMDLGGIQNLRSCDETARVRTTTEVGELFGLTKNTVQKWIRLGWLKASSTRKAKGRRPVALITDEALLAFMDKRDCWPAWHPAAITDPDWQAHGRDLRRAGDWVMCAEIARTHDIRIARIYAWLRERRGQGITFLRYGEGRGREMLVWSADVAALVEQIHGYDWEPGNFLRRAPRDAAGRATRGAS